MTKRARVVLAAALCGLTLASCQYIMRWIDKTGQDRGQHVAESDLRSCSTEIGLDKIGDAPFPDTISRRKAVIAAWGRTQACMADHGWAPDARHYWIDTSGKARADWIAETDAIDCGALNSVGEANAWWSLTKDEQTTRWNKYTACMTEHGWKQRDSNDRTDS